MNELHELHMRLMKHMAEIEKDEHSEDYKDGTYSTIFIVEMFIKEKLEEYLKNAEMQASRYEVKNGTENLKS